MTSSPTRARLRDLGDFGLGLLRDAVSTIRAWSTTRQVVVGLGLTAFLLITWFADVPSVTTLRSWAEATGPWFMVLFWVGHVLLTLFPIPRTLLTLASGVLFGTWTGVLIALTATTASAVIALGVVRYLIGDWMRPRLRHPAVATVNDRLEQRGWLAVTSLRMIAAVPFSVLNYTAALTSVGVGAFTLATLVGSAPGTLVTVFLGDALVGGAGSTALVLTVLIAGLGVVGLIADAKIPVKPAR